MNKLHQVSGWGMHFGTVLLVRRTDFEIELTAAKYFYFIFFFSSIKFPYPSISLEPDNKILMGISSLLYFLNFWNGNSVLRLHAK